MYTFTVTVIFGGKNSKCTIPWSSKKTSIIVFWAWQDRSAFLGRNSFGPIHWQLACFCSGSNTLNQDSSPVMIDHRKSGSCVSLRLLLQWVTRHCFCSCMSNRGTNLGTFFFSSRSFFMMLWTLPVEICTSAETCLTVARQSCWMTCWTARTLAKFLALAARPGCSKSSPVLSPCSARRYQRRQVVLDRHHPHKLLVKARMFHPGTCLEMHRQWCGAAARNKASWLTIFHVHFAGLLRHLRQKLLITVPWGKADMALTCRHQPNTHPKADVACHAFPLKRSGNNAWCSLSFGQASYVCSSRLFRSMPECDSWASAMHMRWKHGQTHTCLRHWLMHEYPWFRNKFLHVKQNVKRVRYGSGKPYGKTSEARNDPFVEQWCDQEFTRTWYRQTHTHRYTHRTTHAQTHTFSFSHAPV